MSALSIGKPSQILMTPQTASLSVPSADGGVSPYFYQWYRDTAYNFTPNASNILAGQTSLNIIDGANPPLDNNAIYYYAVTVTDSTSPTPLTATSPILGICTATQGQTQFEDPSIEQFKDTFDRDFPFGTDIDANIRDKEILKAFQMANAQISVNNYLTQQSFTNACLWLAAHYLCFNINNSSQGLNGQFNWGQASKGVGSVSESFSIPPDIANSPTFQGFFKTTYGALYALDLWPRLIGSMGSVRGWTKP